MNDYIVKLTRNVGIGSDIVNYFEKRGYSVVYNSPDILPKTLMVRSENDIDELRSMMYVDNVVEAPVGRLNTMSKEEINLIVDKWNSIDNISFIYPIEKIGEYFRRLKDDKSN